MDQNDSTMIEFPQEHGRERRIGRMFIEGLAVIGLIAIGALGALLVLRFGSHTPLDPVTVAPTPTATPASGVEQTAGEPAGDVEVVLSPEAVAQAGIKTAQVAVVESSAAIQVPGTVMSVP